MNSTTRTWRLAVGALCVLTLTACGSRADFNTLAAAGDGSGLPSSTASVASTTGGSTPGAVATRAPNGTSGGSTGLLGTTTGTGGGGASGSGTGTSGVGTGGSTAVIGPVKKTPIRLAYIIQGTAGVSAITGSTSTDNASSDVNTQTMNALVSYANAHGGVGGRKISAQGFKSEATSQQADRLALCKQITEDYKAQVMLDSNQYLTEEAWSCFAQHKVNYVGTVTATDRTWLAKNAPYVSTTWMGLDRAMKAIVAGGQSSGWFKGGKVGILLADVPTSHRLYDSVLKPTLANVGITNQLVRYISNEAGGAQQAQTNSAELAFSQAGVNRILFLHNILVYLAFTNQAKSQGYKPWYAFNDYQGMTGVAAAFGTSDVNANAIAVSSSPLSVPDDASRSSTDTTTPINRNKATPGQRRCLDILTKETGKNYYDPNASGDTQATWAFYCDEFFLWWEGANEIGASWAPGQFGGGLQRLGHTYLSALQHSTNYGSGYTDGASSYRVGRYNSSCSCFPKITGWFPI
jgi:hypothetical protein